ncbi:MAG: hypothetical protein AAFR35_12765 [Pseudomonadota bacterium]
MPRLSLFAAAGLAAGMTLAAAAFAEAPLSIEVSQTRMIDQPESCTQLERLAGVDGPECGLSSVQELAEKKMMLDND